MSAIDFPDNPTTNQIFTSGNRSWRWTGSIWNRYSTGGAPEGPTGPIGPTGPQGDSDSGTLTTKGDLLTRTGSALDRLAVSTDGYVLEADSGESTGIKWSDRKSVSINAQTGTTYTFLADDAGKVITATNASAVTVTVPPESSVAFPDGTQIVVAAGGAGAVTIAAGSGVTLNSKGNNLVIDGQYATACCLKTGTDTWLVFGALKT
jgi:hypothetical protein